MTPVVANVSDTPAVAFPAFSTADQGSDVEHKNLYLKHRTVALVSAPFSGGQPRAGVDHGPIQLVSAGLIPQLTSLGWNASYSSGEQFSYSSSLNAGVPITPTTKRAKTDDVHPGSDASLMKSLGGVGVEGVEEPDDDIGKMKKPRLVSKVCKAVRDVVRNHALEGVLPLTLGGDHSLAMGTVAGVFSVHPDAGLIWVDAHADINTPETTGSGNLHGCPVAFLLGLPTTDIAPFNTWLPLSNSPLNPNCSSPSSPPPILSPSRLVYIGLRDVDSGEKQILKTYGIKAFSMHEIDKWGIGEVVRRALEYLNQGYEGDKGGRPIHLSFDVDALDPTVAPSTGTPVRGGLTFREGHYICEAIAETNRLVGFDMVEVNPRLENPAAVRQTVSVGCSLIRSTLGETLL